MNELVHQLGQWFDWGKIKNYFLLLRVSHWSKALFVMLGCFYSSLPGYLISAVLASLAFCLMASAVYIYNDIEDRSEDRLHPHKCYRPLACSRVSVVEAMLVMFALFLSSMLLGLVVSKPLLFILTVYLLMNLAYNHGLKRIPVLDVACIALGFMLRVLAGTIGIGLPLSIWLTFEATLLSLFIALNKRRLEMHLGLQHSTRYVLKKYHPKYLQACVVVTGVAVFITYLLYVIYAREASFYFVLTLPFSAFALWRFDWLSSRGMPHDDPVFVFLNDSLSCLNFMCFAVLTGWALLS